MAIVLRSDHILEWIQPMYPFGKSPEILVDVMSWVEEVRYEQGYP